MSNGFILDLVKGIESHYEWFDLMPIKNTLSSKKKAKNSWRWNFDGKDSWIHETIDSNLAENCSDCGKDFGLMLMLRI
jgi:hypothetical protein